MDARVWIGVVRGEVLSFVLIPVFPAFFFLERREAAGADPGGAHQPGG